MLRRATYRYVNTEELQVDERVQGARRERRVREMADNWDSRAVGIITVSMRGDGSLFLVDGQHRAASALDRRVLVETTDEDGEASREWKADPVNRLYAKVYEGLSLEEEAQMYITLNNTKVPLALDRLAVAATGGDPIAVRVEQTAHKYGWAIRKGTPRIAAPEALRRAADMDDDGEIIDRVLYIVTNAWNHDPKSTRANIIEGLSRLIKAKPHLSDDRMAQVLKRVTPSTVLADVEQLRSTFQAKARQRALATRYDKQLSEARKLYPESE